MMTHPYDLGYRSQPREISVANLPVRGKMPNWLSGTLIRNGPAQFEVGNRPLRHWFDGLAQLHQFTFDGGNVSYANRFLQSRAYRAAHEQGKIAFSEFATDPCRSIFGRLKSLFTLPFTDNCNVNLARLANRVLAMTETPLAIEFDPRTLATLGSFQFSDSVQGQLTTAHPHQDFGRNETINSLTRFSYKSQYQIYALPSGATERRLVASIPVGEPGYMHSFAITENFAVLVEYPLVVSPLRLIFGGKSFIESFRWEPSRGTRFLVIDRREGRLARIHTLPAFFSFHHVNAFERGDEIVLDLCRFDDASVIDRFFLDKLRHTNQEIPTARLCRYRLPADGSTAEPQMIGEESIELPRINYRAVNCLEYSYVYGVSTRRDTTEDTANQLVRLEIPSGRATTWSAAGAYPGEPVFVPAPDARSENDGVLLSVVLDSQRGTSYLLVLDAASFAEIARAEVPQHIPFGFHGQFFGDRE